MTKPEQDSKNPQRRHFTRIPFDAHYRLLSAKNNQEWEGTILDLSLHGVLINRPADIQAERNDPFILEVMLNASEIKLQMMVLVAHVHDSYIGFEVDHIDLESMTHLRRILELNLGDPALLEREINEMLNTRHHEHQS